MGHLNGIMARVGGDLNNNSQTRHMPGGLRGGRGHVLKFRFDRYITTHMVSFSLHDDTETRSLSIPGV